MDAVVDRSARSLPPGAARLEVAVVDGQSAVLGCRATNPSRLLTPVHRGEAVWCYATSFGGGLVAGDHLDLDVEVAAQARAYLTTQASTKVYKCDHGKTARADIRGRVGTGGLLVSWPVHVTAFAGATFHAQAHFELAPDANLVAVDWFTSGRDAYRDAQGVGEQWAFAEFSTRTELWQSGERIAADAIELRDENGLPSISQRMGGQRVLATIFVCGPLMDQVVAAIQSSPTTTGSDHTGCYQSASAIPGGVLWRVAGPAVEPVGKLLRATLAPVADLVGGDPWARTW